MITLDGVEYTFNGYGEYHILRVAGPEFKLQGRMQPLINEDDSATRATVYKAFAMKENDSDVVQVMFWNGNTSNRYNSAMRFYIIVLPLPESLQYNFIRPSKLVKSKSGVANG